MLQAEASAYTVRSKKGKKKLMCTQNFILNNLQQGAKKNSLDNYNPCRIKSTTQMLKRSKAARPPRSVENEEGSKGRRSTIHNSDSS